MLYIVILRLIDASGDSFVKFIMVQYQWRAYWGPQYRKNDLMFYFSVTTILVQTNIVSYQ